AGFRRVTDPTFDAPGEYRLSYVTLTKTSGPALAADAIGEVDAVLLSHDQHSDNLDRAGRAFLAKARRVLTTTAGAARLDGNAEGLRPWQATQLTGPQGQRLEITAAPPRHGAARAPGPRRPGAHERRLHGFRAALRARDDPPDLHHRRHGLVRPRRGGRPPLPRRSGAAVRRRRADARPVPPHHGHQ